MKQKAHAIISTAFESSHYFHNFNPTLYPPRLPIQREGAHNNSNLIYVCFSFICFSVLFISHLLVGLLLRQKQLEVRKWLKNNTIHINLHKSCSNLRLKKTLWEEKMTKI